MAYKNERHLKRNEIKVRFNDDDLDVIDAVANLTRSQRAVLVREYAMREIRRLSRLNSPVWCAEFSASDSQITRA